MSDCSVEVLTILLVLISVADSLLLISGLLFSVFEIFRFLCFLFSVPLEKSGRPCGFDWCKNVDCCWIDGEL